MLILPSHKKKKKYEWNKINTRVCEGSFALALPGARNQTLVLFSRRTGAANDAAYYVTSVNSLTLNPLPWRLHSARQNRHENWCVGGISMLSTGRYAVAGCGKGRREAPRWGVPTLRSLPAALEAHGSDATIRLWRLVLADAMLHETNRDFPAIRHVLSILLWSSCFKPQISKSLNSTTRYYSQFY